jgi:hypothetical protein
LLGFDIAPRTVSDIEFQRLSLLAVEDTENRLTVAVKQLEADGVAGSDDGGHDFSFDTC